MKRKRRGPLSDTWEGILCQMLYSDLLVLATKGKCDEAVCRWDVPCHKCFAACAISRYIDMPEFRRNRAYWKVVQKQKKRVKK